MTDAIYSGEALLLRWGESSTNGRTVTLQLEDGPDAATRHPFHGLKTGAQSGQRFAIVAVPLADDQHVEGDAGKTTPEQKAGQHPLVQRAGILCADKRFRDWFCGPTPISADVCAKLLRANLNVASRRELATNPEAQEKFEKLVARYRQETGQSTEARP